MERALCHRCGHSNPETADKCEACGRHLFVFCHCGARNLRANLRCTACRANLRIIHRPPLQLVGADRATSHSSDLGVAIALFVLVIGGLAAIALGPLFVGFEEARVGRTEQREMELRREREAEIRRLLLLQREIEMQKQGNFWRQWIGGH